MIVCPSLSHFAAKILIGIKLEARAVASVSSMEVKDCLDLPYTVIKTVDVNVTPSLEAILTEPLRFEFAEHTMFYCVFYHKELDVVYVPSWFQQIMVSTARNTIEITSQHNMPDSQIKVVLPQLKLSKFDIITNQLPG